MNFLKNQKGSVKVVLIVLGILLGGVIFLGLGSYFKYTSLQKIAVNHETGLNAQYLENQNMLSEFVNGFYEQLGLANLKSEKMDKIITDAVSARYGDEGFSSDGAFFAAVKEAYPDLAGLNIYDKIADYVRAKRAEFKNVQTKILSMIQAYDSWRIKGGVDPWIIKNIVGVPTDNLEARIGETVYYGKEALSKMKQIVISGKAKDAFKTGEMGPLEVK